MMFYLFRRSRSTKKSAKVDRLFCCYCLGTSHLTLVYVLLKLSLSRDLLRGPSSVSLVFLASHVTFSLDAMTFLFFGREGLRLDCLASGLSLGGGLLILQ